MKATAWKRVGLENSHGSIAKGSVFYARRESRGQVGTMLSFVVPVELKATNFIM